MFVNSLAEFAFMDIDKNKMNTLSIILAKPRGFCAGVERAIEIVERAIKKYPHPIYVHHEIVHNRFVVNDLKSRGVIFVESIADVPKGALCIFSAHGVSKKVEDDADEKLLQVIDATCPLVKKVHFAAQRHKKFGNQIILIGHKNHPEVVGTSGRVNDEVILVQNVKDVHSIEVKDPDNLAYITQTTLSVDETRDIIDALKERFPNIIGPELKDICFATQNRQDAVKKLIQDVELLLVIGSKNSSNSNRLKDLGTKHKKPSYLLDNAEVLNVEMFDNISSVGITAGASAPESILESILQWFEENFTINVSTMDGVEENIVFKLPKLYVHTT